MGDDVAESKAAQSPPPPPPPTSDSDHDESRQSLVEYYGSGVNFCGYCKRDESENSEGRRSYDMKAYRLTPDDYQKLLDRGWRRSGNYCYNPLNMSTCCPNFAISCEALQFKISRSQRRVVENLNAFLVNGQTNNQTITAVAKPKFHYASSTCQVSEQLHSASSHTNRSFTEIKNSSKARDKRFVKSCERKVRLYNISLDEAIIRTKQRAQSRQSKESVDRPNSLEQLLFPKNKEVQIEGLNSVSSTSSPKPKHNLQIRLLHVKSSEIQALREEEHRIMVRYQMAVHKETEEDWTMKRFSDFLVDSPIIVEPMRDRDYIIQNDDNQQVVKIGQALSTNPKPADQEDDYLFVKPPELPTAYGTFHCVYLLDGKLIAVGVLDVLTKCVTTVYFFYDPDYGHLNLGIYSALIEISLVRRLVRHYSGPAEKNKLTRYYLGFYVHECKKMHYKTRFRPSYLLCSETCRYIPTESCLKKLLDKKYSRFDPNPISDDDVNKLIPTIADIMDIPVAAPVIENSTDMTVYLRWLKTNLGSEYADLLINYLLVQYVKLIGRPLITRLRLQVNAVHRALVDKHRRVTMPNEAASSSSTSSSSASTSTTSTSS